MERLTKIHTIVTQAFNYPAWATVNHWCINIMFASFQIQLFNLQVYFVLSPVSGYSASLITDTLISFVALQVWF